MLEGSLLSPSPRAAVAVPAPGSATSLSRLVESASISHGNLRGHPVRLGSLRDQGRPVLLLAHGVLGRLRTLRYLSQEGRPGL